MAIDSLDDYDKEILKLLRDNGRLTNQELSDIVGLSSSQCSRRRIALEQEGHILGYHAQLSPKGDGTPVRDVYKVTGSYDYLMKVAVEGLPALNALITRLAALRDCIASLRTSVVLERIKENGVLMPAA